MEKEWEQPVTNCQLKMKEKTLAEKAWKLISDPSNKEYDLEVMATEDVKEFIKEIMFNLTGNIGEDMDMIKQKAGELAE